MIAFEMVQADQKRRITAASIAVSLRCNRTQNDFKKCAGIAAPAVPGHCAQEARTLNFERRQASLEYRANELSLVAEMILNSIVVGRTSCGAYGAQRYAIQSMQAKKLLGDVEDFLACPRRALNSLVHHRRVVLQGI